MTKNKKNFYDEYDKLFVKPKIGLNPLKKKKMIKRIVMILSVPIFLMALLWFVTVKPEWMPFLNYAPDKKEYPLENDVIVPVDKSQIDQSDPLYLELEDNKLLINKGYQFEFKENVEIISKTQKEWSIIPSTEEYGTFEDILTADLYKDQEHVDTLIFRMFPNMVNHVTFYMTREKGEFFKTFPLPSIDDVQIGYTLIHLDNNDIVYNYYIFKDGTGVLVIVSMSDTEEKTNITENLSEEEFRQLFGEKLSLYEESVSFSKQ